MRSLYVGIPLLLLAAVWQTAVQPYFPIVGLMPHWPVLLAVTWGLVHSPEDGVAWAFVAGLMSDLFSAGPMGAGAMALITAALLAALVQHSLPTNRVLLPAVLGGGAAYIYYVLHMALVWAAGYPIPTAVSSFFLGRALLHAVLTIPVYWLMYRLWQRFSPPPVRGGDLF